MPSFPSTDIAEERQFLIDAGFLLSSRTLAEEILLLKRGFVEEENTQSSLAPITSNDFEPLSPTSTITTTTSSIVSARDIVLAKSDYIMRFGEDEKTALLVCNNNRMIVMLYDDNTKSTFYTQPITFLGLPLEVRDKIYEFVFAGESIEVMNWIPKNARRKWEYLEFATITVVSKQIRAESLRAFRKHCDIYISDVMRAYHTVQPRLCCKDGIFDGNLLQKITIDYIPEHVQGWPSLRALRCDFPQLKSLTLKVLLTDAFDWSAVDLAQYHPDLPNTTGWAMQGSLTNSSELRNDLFGKVLACKTKLALAVLWAEEGLDVGAGDQLEVFVRMRVYACLSSGLSAQLSAFGTLVADVRREELRYVGSGRSEVVELEEWAEEPFVGDEGALKLVRDQF